MLGGGYFNPLTGYMNKADALSVAKDMKTTSGLFWPVPILNLVKAAGSIKAGDRIALKDPNVEGNPVLAVMDVKAVEEFSDAEMALMSEKIYRPRPPEAHPGVDAFNAQGKVCLSGPIKVLNFSYSRMNSRTPSVLQLKFVTKSLSAAGRRLLLSRLVTRCTWHTKNFATWQWIV
jgi:sulfate adenylyltransferase